MPVDFLKAGAQFGLMGLVLVFLLWQNYRMLDRMVDALTQVAKAMTSIAEKVEHLSDAK